MKLIYLSYYLDADTPFYGGEESFQIESVRSMAAGDVCNTSRWSFLNHAGTHVDLPRHFSFDGKCLHEYPPDYWIFSKVALIDVSGCLPVSVVGTELLEDIHFAPDIELLLIKTGSGAFRGTATYWQAGPVFRPELADYLRSKLRSLRAIGFDAISVSSWNDRVTGRSAHCSFLGGISPILLIEDVNLTLLDASQQILKVTVAPLLVREADAAPCTIIAEVAT